MRKIYFVMIFAALLLMLFAVSCDFNIFEPLEEIEVPSAPIPQRATNSAGIDVVEDAELLNIIERLEYEEGALEKVTHTFEIDGKTVSYNAEDGMLQIDERVARLSQAYFTKVNGRLFNHGIIPESYLKFSHVQTDIPQNFPSASERVSVSPIEDIIEEVYGWRNFKLKSIYLDITPGILPDEDVAKGLTNWKLVVTGEYITGSNDVLVSPRFSIYIIEEEFLDIYGSSYEETVYIESMGGMGKPAVDAVVSAFERKREQLKP